MGKMGHKKKSKSIVYFEDEVVKKEDAINILNDFKEKEENNKLDKHISKQIDDSNVESINKKRRKKKSDKAETQNNLETELPEDNYITVKKSKKRKTAEVEQPTIDMSNIGNVDEKVKKNKKRKKSEDTSVSTKNMKQKKNEGIETEEPEKKSKKQARLKDNPEMASPNSPKHNKDQEETESEDSESESDIKQTDSANMNIPRAESKRSIKRKKHAKLIEEKKSQSDLKMQQSVLNYLSKWKHARQEWKFEKLKQIWLQQNLFVVHKIPAEFWSVIVEYFNGAKGITRKVILTEALKIIEKEDNAEEKNEDEDYQVRLTRARDIIQNVEE